MVCPNCGAVLEDFDAFCPGCGKTIQKNPDGTLTAVDPQSPTEPSEAPPKKVAKRLYPPEEADNEPKAAAPDPALDKNLPSSRKHAPEPSAPAPKTSTPPPKAPTTRMLPQRIPMQRAPVQRAPLKRTPAKSG